MQVLYRANECGDFGAWDQLFREMDPEKLKKYKRIMFINDTVRGPFVDPNYLLLMPEVFIFSFFSFIFLFIFYCIHKIFIDFRDSILPIFSLLD